VNREVVCVDDVNPLASQDANQSDKRQQAQSAFVQHIYACGNAPGFRLQCAPCAEATDMGLESIAIEETGIVDHQPLGATQLQAAYDVKNPCFPVRCYHFFSLD